jgi:hypothetical protein
LAFEDREQAASFAVPVSYETCFRPAQAQRALHGLIHAWHLALDQGLPAIPADTLAPLEHEFRHAVLAGLASVPRVPGPKTTVKQKPGRELLEFCNVRRDDVLRFTADTKIWPTNNISERGVRPVKTQQKISGRLATPRNHGSVDRRYARATTAFDRHVRPPGGHVADHAPLSRRARGDGMPLVHNLPADSAW